MATAVQQEMQEYFAELNEIEQKQVLEIVKNFLSNPARHSLNVSIEEYNREIDEGIAEIEQGNYMTQEELEKYSSQWHLKYFGHYRQ